MGFYRIFTNYSNTFYRMCPIFQVSNVSGENLNLLKMFMNLLQITVCPDLSEPAEFQIDSTFSVPVSYYCQLGRLIFLTILFLSIECISHLS